MRCDYLVTGTVWYVSRKLFSLFIFCFVQLFSQVILKRVVCCGAKRPSSRLSFFLLLLFLEISVVNYVMYDTSDRGLLKRCWIPLVIVGRRSWSEQVYVLGVLRCVCLFFSSVRLRPVSPTIVCLTDDGEDRLRARQFAQERRERERERVTTERSKDGSQFRHVARYCTFAVLN